MKKLTFICLATLALACSQFKVSTTEAGDRIQFHKNADGETIQLGDMVVVDLHITDENDTTYRNTFLEGQPLKINAMQGQFVGSFENALLQLSEGDSATVFVKVDSLYGGMQQQLPPNVSKGSDFKFLVAVRDIMTPDEYSESLKEKKVEEDKIIQNYVAEAMPGADSLGGFGIYYTTDVKGSGSTPSRGDTVMVNYIGKFIEGGIFDQSSPGQPLTFPVGVGYVIKGWDTAVMSMKKGQKGTFIIPSRLAYGERGAGGKIPPFTPLVFEMELVDIK